ncbi:MAG TPA: DUF2892 domain-containing protein [Candidatus Limiplasma sp.]|nr:DUF2892 domain-containing protein [Candidatus Limiplasma sp.]HPS81170.1 DUF2892 domain-containing protein [Candidatus Limiplasma sp.]
MKKNVGTTDKWIRIVLGIILLTLLFVIQSGWRWIGLVGLIPLGTGLLNYCPLYSLFGISTNKSEHKDA